MVDTPTLAETFKTRDSSKKLNVSSLSLVDSGLTLESIEELLKSCSKLKTLRVHFGRYRRFQKFDYLVWLWLIRSLGCQQDHLEVLDLQTHENQILHSLSRETWSLQSFCISRTMIVQSASLDSLTPNVICVSFPESLEALTVLGYELPVLNCFKSLVEKQMAPVVWNSPALKTMTFRNDEIFDGSLCDGKLWLQAFLHVRSAASSMQISVERVLVALEIRALGALLNSTATYS